jgi:hypothetical protein
MNTNTENNFINSIKIKSGSKSKSIHSYIIRICDALIMNSENLHLKALGKIILIYWITI